LVADESSSPRVSEAEPSYFEFQAPFGATKHGGGLRATEELAELCHIGHGKLVLDVGCGVGMAPCDLAKRYGCRVIGVDIREGMLTKAADRARREGVERLVEFRVADAQELPFEDGHFDAVIAESVTALLEDKARGVGEYVRVAKPGGHVGINEMTWLKPGPPPALVEYYYLTTGARPETVDGWQELLGDRGLTDAVVKTYRMSVVDEYIDGLRRFALRDLLSSGRQFLSLAVSSPGFRRFARDAIPSMSVVKAIFGYLGYGLYAGKK
jgi:ubiquinone/menaquinone biosynthesis C-methylase UbiE